VPGKRDRRRGRELQLSTDGDEGAAWGGGGYRACGYGAIPRKWPYKTLGKWLLTGE
jgi:hypothetical protein